MFYSVKNIILSKRSFVLKKVNVFLYINFKVEEVDMKELTDFELEKKQGSSSLSY